MSLLPLFRLESSLKITHSEDSFYCRCDNGTAFVGRLLSLIAAEFGIHISLIQPGCPQQNGGCERSHRPHHEKVACLLQEYSGKAGSANEAKPPISNFEAHQLASAIRNKQWTRVLGCSPWEYRYSYSFILFSLFFFRTALLAITLPSLCIGMVASQSRSSAPSSMGTQLHQVKVQLRHLFHRC